MNGRAAFRAAAVLGILVTGLGGAIGEDSVKSQAVGKILKFRTIKMLLVVGDKVTVVFNKKSDARLHAKFVIIKAQPDLINSSSEGEDEGEKELVLGELEIEKMLSPKWGIARITVVRGDIEPGNYLKKLETGPQP